MTECAAQQVGPVVIIVLVEVNSMKKYTKPAARPVSQGTVLRITV